MAEPVDRSSREAGQRELWDALRTVLRSAGSGPPLVRIDRRAPLEASCSQERFWLLDRLDPGNPANNLSAACRMRGRLDAAVLERSLTEVLRRHEALRTSLHFVDGQLIQLVAAPRPVRLKVEHRKHDGGEDEIARIATEEASRPFDLARAAPIRFRLVRRAAAEHVLFVTAHHSAFDNWSFDLLLHEVGSCYQSLSCGLPHTLGELPIQYADYAAWQRRRLRGAELAPLARHWTKALEGPARVVQLPADRPRDSKARHRSALHSFQIPTPLTTDLGMLADREGATLFVLLLAACKFG
jgi:hypothetical protein